MGYITSAAGSPVPDYNPDAGPGLSYQGDGIPDVRLTFLKDKVQGYTGVVPGAANLTYLQSVDAVPATLGGAKISALANAVSGTPVTLVTTPAAGISINIPIVPFSGALNGNPVVTAPIVLDFGFATGNCTSGSKTIVVADSSLYGVGMPLVIAHVGNAGGTAALLTFVTGITDLTHITVNDAPLATNAAAPVGTGNVWMPREGQDGIEPTAHLPYLAAGPGLFLDPAQALARAVSITGVASGTGGNFTVRGWDVYWQPMSEVIAAGAGVSTVNGKKAFKAIASVTPAFTDAHTYSVGTTDIYGFHFRSDRWEYSSLFWNGTFTTTSTGWTVADKTSPATGTTGDVRGTFVTPSASDGTKRLAIFQSIPVYNITRGTPFNSAPAFGVTQFTN